MYWSLFQALCMLSHLILTMYAIGSIVLFPQMSKLSDVIILCINLDMKV